MKATKQKILEAALILFNSRGLVNVRLQNIADEAAISVGNLAYHYPNKEAIVLALYEQLTEKQEEVLAEYRIVPLFDNINRLLSRTFQLQKTYVFFYLDTLEIIRAYPLVAEKHRQHIHYQVNQLHSILNFNASRGALIAEPKEGLFLQLATQLWMNTDLWLTQKAIRGQDEFQDTDYLQAIWALVIPYFTSMGKLEYEQMLQMPDDIFF